MSAEVARGHGAGLSEQHGGTKALPKAEQGRIERSGFSADARRTLPVRARQL